MRDTNRFAVLFLVIAVLVLSLVCGDVFGQVVLNGSKAIDTEKQWAFVTVTIDGQEYKFTHVAPANITGTALQDFVSKQEAAYTRDILADLERGPWKQTHPEIFQAGTVERDQMLADVKNLIENLTYADIDNHIDTVFAGLSVAQRASLKKLYKAVLFLLKR